MLTASPSTWPIAPARFGTVFHIKGQKRYLRVNGPALRHFYLQQGKSTQIYKSILSFLPSFLPLKRLKEAVRGQKSTGTWVIEATDFRIEVRCDL